MATNANVNLENLWNHFETQINNGSVDDIELAAAMHMAIGAAGVHFLSTRFQAMIGAPVSIINDSQSGSVRLVPAYNLDSQYVDFSAIPKPMHTTKVKVARPPNAFIMYRTYYHPIIKAANPDIHNTSISAILGSQWKNETAEIKDRFRIAAENVKQEHSAKYPGYQYQPRKPSEKKRRMTRRKAAEALLSGESFEDSQAIVPKFDETVTGNPTFELGDQGLDDETLHDMLKDFNASIINPADGNAVLYYEDEEESQNETNFFSSILDIDPSVLDNEGKSGNWAVDFMEAAKLAKQQAAIANRESQIAFDNMLTAEMHRQDEYYRLLNQP